ncbi:Prenyltransferase family protein isoform 2 [Hibiscus syriacus]|uniref:Prenyltransferase family protein isoform 2 n=1 Tax=Hibiscus syriacus TaxID=106335 RepID=A0A6A2YSU9_HIBSY|nr:Prenyltransferase family protein isoform 2 [Hibiscus syriacus]
MILINEVDRLDLSSLIDWVVFQQGVEGGFQGRTKKLVDGCYSSWQGGIFTLIKRLNSTKGERSIPLGDGEDSDPESPQTTASSDATEEDQHDTSSRDNADDIGHNSSKGHAKVDPLFNSLALQQYILLCSQAQTTFYKPSHSPTLDPLHAGNPGPAGANRRCNPNQTRAVTRIGPEG